MYQRVNLATSLPRNEVDRIDVIGVRVGNRRFRRAGTLRLMLRFALAHEEDLIDWFEATDGQPYVGGE